MRWTLETFLKKRQVSKGQEEKKKPEMQEAGKSASQAEGMTEQRAEAGAGCCVLGAGEL